MAAAAGVVVATLLLVVIGLNWLASILLGGLVFVICGYVFPGLFCSSATPTVAEPSSAPRPAAPTPAPAPAKDTAPAEAVPADAAPAVPVEVSPAAPVAAPAAGEKPETLSAARGGMSDNLKLIKGVGPKLEQLLNRMGFYHFDQIAAWSGGQVAWVDQNLEGFKGRVTRDGWVAQARTLAAGGETEFSKRSKGKRK